MTLNYCTSRALSWSVSPTTNKRQCPVLCAKLCLAVLCPGCYESCCVHCHVQAAVCRAVRLGVSPRDTRPGPAVTALTARHFQSENPSAHIDVNCLVVAFSRPCKLRSVCVCVCVGWGVGGGGGGEEAEKQSEAEEQELTKTTIHGQNISIYK